MGFELATSAALPATSLSAYVECLKFSMLCVKFMHVKYRALQNYWPAGVACLHSVHF